MDLFGGGGAPREHRETRVVTGDDAWLAAAASGDLDLASVNREAARRAGLAERAVAPAWAALALEALARRALGARVVSLDLRYPQPLFVGEEVTLALVTLDEERARVEARTARGVVADGTLRVRHAEGVA